MAHASASVRNYSRPLQNAQPPSEGPLRPPRSPLRTTHSLDGGKAPPSPGQRRRAKSSGPATAPRPTFDVHAPLPMHQRQRSLSSDTASDFRAQEFPHVLGARIWDDLDHDSGRSSPSSPTTFIPPAEFVASGGPRDSVLTQDSGITESSLYPSTLSGDESPSPRIASFNDMSFNSLDADDVSYRLDLLVRNNYFLPPAHAKPSVSELSLLGPDATPKKSPRLKPISPSFRDFFRKTKPSVTAPHSPEFVPAHPPAASRVSVAPHTTPLVPPSIQRAPPTPRIAVLRERLDDLEKAAQDAEREMRLRTEDQPPQSMSRLASFDDVDPTDEVDLPEYLVPAEDVAPRAPFSEDDSWRRDLLEQAVGLSFRSHASGPAPVPGPSMTTRSKRNLGQNAVANSIPTDRRARRTKSTSPPRREKRSSNDVPAQTFGAGRHVVTRPSHDGRRPSIARSIASVQSQPTPSTLSPAALISQPILSPSETSQFSTLHSRPAAPTPSRAMPMDTLPPPSYQQRLPTMSQHVDFDSLYRSDSPPLHMTALSPAPPRKPPGLRSRGNSKASSTTVEIRRAASSPALKEPEPVVEDIAPPPAFVLEDPSGTRAPVSLPTMSTMASVTSGSHYSDDEEVESPPIQRRAPSLDAREHTSYVRDSYDERRSMDGRPSFDMRPSIDGRPSLTISVTSLVPGRPGSPRSLHSSTFGDGYRTSREVPPPVPAPYSASTAFFDEVQDRFLSQGSSSDSETDRGDDDEELVHLGRPVRPASRAATPPVSSPVTASGRMAWREPVSHIAEPGAAAAGGHAAANGRGRDKGLEMLQRAQAGSVVSLGARSTRSGTSSLREELTERDAADRRLEGLLVQHIEEERDRMRRIASGLSAALHG